MGNDTLTIPPELTSWTSLETNCLLEWENPIPILFRAGQGIGAVMLSIKS